MSVQTIKRKNFPWRNFCNCIEMLLSSKKNEKEDITCRRQEHRARGKANWTREKRHRTTENYSKWKNTSGGIKIEIREESINIHGYCTKTENASVSICAHSQVLKMWDGMWLSKYAWMRYEKKIYIYNIHGKGTPRRRDDDDDNVDNG